MFYFQQLLQTALNGIDSANVTGAVLGVAGAILLLSFLYSAYQAFAAGGDVRMLAVTGPKPLAELPGVPTLGESGVRDATMEMWTGLFAPKGTPPAIVAKLEAAAMEAVKSPGISAKLRNLGVEPSGMPGAEFARVIERDLHQAVEVARAANVKIED